MHSRCGEASERTQRRCRRRRNHLRPPRRRFESQSTHWMSGSVAGVPPLSDPAETTTSHRTQSVRSRRPPSRSTLWEWRRGIASASTASEGQPVRPRRVRPAPHRDVLRLHVGSHLHRSRNGYHRRNDLLPLHMSSPRSVTVLSCTVNTQQRVTGRGDPRYRRLKSRLERSLRHFGSRAILSPLLHQESTSGRERIEAVEIYPVNVEIGARRGLVHAHFTLRVYSRGRNVLSCDGSSCNGDHSSQPPFTFQERARRWFADDLGLPGVYFHIRLQQHDSAVLTYHYRKRDFIASSTVSVQRIPPPSIERLLSPQVITL